MIEVILSVFAVIALVILAAAVFLRMVSRKTDEQFDYCDACTSEPMPLDDVFRKNGAI